MLVRTICVQSCCAIIGNQVKILSGPAAVMRECLSDTTGFKAWEGESAR